MNQLPSSEEPRKKWTTRISKAKMYADYCAWCDKHGEPKDDVRQFFARIYQVIPSAKTVYTRVGNKREHFIELPTLAKAREEFQNYYCAGPEIWQKDEGTQFKEDVYRAVTTDSPSNY